MPGRTGGVGLLGAIFQSLFSKQKIEAEQIEQLKEKAQLADLMAEFAEALPEVKRPLIDERDRYMISRIAEQKGKRVVAVVGAGHVPGMQRELGRPVDRAELEVIPPPSKLARALKAEARPAHPDEVRQHLGVSPGSIGPVGVRGARIVADESLREGRYVVGANREGFHLAGVTPGQDFACEWADLQVALAGEACPSCGKPLRIERVIEIGNIFKLGTRYSVPLGATYLDEAGKQQPIVMGSYGIGPARIAAAAVEQRHDADGIVWP